MTASPAEIDFPRQLGQYRVVRELGRGGMARVFEAEHIHLNKRVAVKVMHSLFRGEAASEARFLREGRAAARVRHLHVVEVFDVGVEAGVPFLVMEYLEGQTLAQLLHARGSLPLQTVVEIFLPVLSAVAAAHDLGLVHRDLKPSNVMLTLQNRGALHPIVLDFGISKLADEDESLTVSGTVLGTVHYLAPEQANGAKFSSAQSDQYALGVMLYECVTGERPFSGDGHYNLMHAIVTGNVRPVEELNPSLPRELAAIIRRAMRRAPELRFASVRELGRALLPFASPAESARWAAEFDQTTERVDETAVSLEVLAAPATGATPVTLKSSHPPSDSSWLRSVGIGAALVAAGALAMQLWSPGRNEPVVSTAAAMPPTVPAPTPAAKPEPAAAPSPAGTASVTPAPVAATTSAPSVAAVAVRKPPAAFAPAARAPISPKKPASKPATSETGTNNVPIIE
jgi:serine/threonine-protein kinase